MTSSGTAFQNENKFKWQFKCLDELKNHLKSTNTILLPNSFGCP